MPTNGPQEQDEPDYSGSDIDVEVEDTPAEKPEEETETPESEPETEKEDGCFYVPASDLAGYDVGDTVSLKVTGKTPDGELQLEIAGQGGTEDEPEVELRNGLNSRRNGAAMMMNQ